MWVFFQDTQINWLNLSPWWETGMLEINKFHRMFRKFTPFWIRIRGPWTSNHALPVLDNFYWNSCKLLFILFIAVYIFNLPYKVECNLKDIEHWIHSHTCTDEFGCWSCQQHPLTFNAFHWGMKSLLQTTVRCKFCLTDGRVNV